MNITYYIFHRDEYNLAGGKRVQLLVWAPVGAGLAFVMNNNVHYQSESERQINTYRQITNSTRDVYNGVADWVYEGNVKPNILYLCSIILEIRLKGSN